MTAHQPVAGKGFNQRLKALKPWQQQVFALVLAQRSAPNYLLFCEATGQGDAELFRHLLALCWEDLIARQSSINWPVQQEKLPSLQPDVETSDLYGVYPALDAVMALELVIEQAITPDAETAIRASRLSRSTVRQYLALSLPQDMDEQTAAKILRGEPLMQDENDFQDELLLQLETADQPPDWMVLKKLASNEGYSNLGICLDGDQAAPEG